MRYQVYYRTENGQPANLYDSVSSQRAAFASARMAQGALYAHAGGDVTIEDTAVADGKPPLVIARWIAGEKGIYRATI